MGKKKKHRHNKQKAVEKVSQNVPKSKTASPIVKDPFETMTLEDVSFENETLDFLFRSDFVYDDFIAYVLEKNEEVSGDYILRTSDGTGFRKNPNITKAGYEIHHIGENEVADLSQERCWHMREYQQKDALVYVDYIEHCWAHYLIAKEDKSLFRTLGWGGLFNHKMLARVAGMVSANDYQNLQYLVYRISDQMKERVLNMRKGIIPPSPVSIREQAETKRWQELYETYPYGITKITSEQYGKQLAIKMGNLNRCGVSTVYVLRTESDVFSFIGENPDNNRFYFLSGGAMSLAAHKPEWYYSKLDDYFNICTDFIFKYKQMITPISEYIKSLGGDGYIHGLIIDIDFFHHLKVDIENNRLIPYYAPSTSCRIIYPSLNVMIKQLAEKNGQEQALIPYKHQELVMYENAIHCKGLETPICNEAFYSEEKGFYRRNRQMGSIYRSADSRIIKKWEDKFDTDRFWNEYYTSLKHPALTNGIPEVVTTERSTSYKEPLKKLKVTHSLKSYNIPEKTFNEILSTGYPVKVITNAEEFNKYKIGYERKKTIMYDGFKTAIMLECVLNEHFPLKNTDITHWRQCIIHKESI